MTFAYLKYKFDTDEVINQLLTMRDRFYEEEKIKTLKRLLPIGEEVTNLQEKKDCLNDLTTVNYFMFHLLKIPGLDQHLRCQEIKLCEFDVKFLEFNQKLDILSDAVRIIDGNEAIKQIFLIIIKIGNFLN